MSKNDQPQPENGTALVRAPERNIKATIARVKETQAFVKEALKDGMDFQKLPNTKHEVLLQPGAEKIALYFGARPEYVVTTTELGEGHVDYGIICNLYSHKSGFAVGQGLASACTMESKYRYRYIDVPKPEWPDKAGGRILKQKGIGKWKIEGQGNNKIFYWQMRQENPNIWDERHTVKLIAAKRAFIKAVRTMAGVSEIFTQDLDDFPNLRDVVEQEGGGKPPETAAPAAPAQEKPAATSDDGPAGQEPPHPAGEDSAPTAAESKPETKKSTKKAPKKSATKAPARQPARTRSAWAKDLRQAIGCADAHVVSFIFRMLGIQDIRQAGKKNLDALLGSLQKMVDEETAQQELLNLIMDDEPSDKTKRRFNELFAEMMKK